MKSFIWLYIIFIYFINYTYSENITITVGERGLYFSPQNITAKYNDAIKWVFLNGRHQVVQSDGPAGSCVKSSDINAFSSILKEGGEFSYIITQKSGTIYYFCSFSSHCAYGMWGTINIDPNPTSNSSPQTTTTYNPEPTPTPSDSENLPIIIGSSIGGFFALAISGLIIFMLYRRNKYQKQFEIAMQPYDPKLNVGDGNDRISNSDGNIGIPATSASSVNLSRTNTNTYDDHSNNEVIMSNISPNMASIAPSIVSNIVPNTQLNEETMRGYDDRASSVYRGRDSLYQYNASDGERSERSKSPPTYNPTLNTNYNPYDNEKSYLRQQQQQPPFPQQSLQQPPIPPRPNNFPPSQQQFGAPYLPPRPLAVNRFPPQYGPSSSPPPLQEFQYNASSDPFGPANPGQHYQHRQSNLPRPPPPPPSQPPPSLPLPPPPNQQQTGHYIIDPSQYYGPNNSDN